MLSRCEIEFLQSLNDEQLELLLAEPEVRQALCEHDWLRAGVESPQTGGAMFSGGECTGDDGTWGETDDS